MVIREVSRGSVGIERRYFNKTQKKSHMRRILTEISGRADIKISLMKLQLSTHAEMLCGWI